MSDAEFESNILQMGGITLHPGERIGPYVYERPVGKGGMALVVLARDPNDDPVALKILRGNRLKTGLQRFRRVAPLRTARQPLRLCASAPTQRSW